VDCRAPSAWARSSFTARFIASATRGSASALTRATRSAGGSALVHSIFGTLCCASRSCCSATSSCRPFCATLSASTISASAISPAPPSTIMMESAVPLTTMSTSENSSCWKVGLRIHFPSTRPTRTPASGPANGIFELASAKLAATIPSTSASFSWSAERT